MSKFRRFLRDRSRTELPSTVITLLDDVARRSSRLRDLGMTQLVECTDPALGGAAIEQRVKRAGEAALAQRRYVTAIDVFLGLGWLTPPQLDDWRRGRVQCLERVVQASLPKLSWAMRAFRRWTQGRGLVPSETGYIAGARGRRPLRSV